MATEVFQRGEHEFLRLAALANPDWQALKDLAQGSLDWTYLREQALLHQLDGVVPWRCIAPELDGFVPELVQEESQGNLAHLDSARGAWVETASAVAERLREHNVTFYYWGFPTPYGLLGMDPDTWPRAGTSLSFTSSPADFDALVAALRSLARVVVMGGIWVSEVRMPNGMVVHADCLAPPEAATDEYSFTYSDGWMHLARPKTVYGVELPILPAEAQIVRRAFEINRAIESPTPLSLGELAHIANLIASTPAFDWDQALELLDQAARHTKAVYDHVAAQTDLETAPQLHRQMRELFLQGSMPRRIVWLWEMVDRIYDVFPAERLAACWELVGEGPLVWRMNAEEVNLRSDVEHFKHVFARVDGWPDDEAALFDLRDRYSIDNRVEDGVLTLPFGTEDIPLQIYKPTASGV